MGATAILYTDAAVAELAGCFAFWAWLRLARSTVWLVPGCGALVLFAYLLTLVDANQAGRAYAAYGGIYITAALCWLWIVGRRPPGSLGCARGGVMFGGACVILLGPHRF